MGLQCSSHFLPFPPPFLFLFHFISVTLSISLSLSFSYMAYFFLFFIVMLTQFQKRENITMLQRIHIQNFICVSPTFSIWVASNNSTEKHLCVFLLHFKHKKMRPLKTPSLGGLAICSGLNTTVCIFCNLVQFGKNPGCILAHVGIDLGHKIKRGPIHSALQLPLSAEQLRENFRDSARVSDRQKTC